MWAVFAGPERETGLGFAARSGIISSRDRVRAFDPPVEPVRNESTVDSNVHPGTAQKERMIVRYLLIAATGVVLAMGNTASADSVRFQGAIGSGHAASTTFGTLDDARNPYSTPAGIFVRIENTMSSDFDSVDSRVLTGLFFNIEGSPDLSSYIDTSRGDNGWEAFAGTQLGGPAGADPLNYWTFRDDLGDRSGDNAIPDGFNDPRYGFSAAGLDVFGPGDVIGDPTLDPPNPNGIDGGVLSPTADPMNGNGQQPLWRSFIEIQLYLTEDFFFEYGEPVFSDIAWQFGSGFDEPGFPADTIPLPTGAAMGLLGFGLVASRRRR